MNRPRFIFLISISFIVILLSLIRCPSKENSVLSFNEIRYQEGRKLYNEKQFKLAAKALRDVEKEDSLYTLAQSLLVKIDSLILVEDSTSS